MKIISTSVDVVRLPLRVPFTTSLRSTDHVTDIRVQLETDSGLVGCGSASPTPAITGETTESIHAALTQFILPRLAGLEVEDADTAFHAVESAIVKNHAAKAAVDIALHDLLAKQHNQPLMAWLRPQRAEQERPIVVTDSTVSLATPEAMAAQAVQLLGAGFTILKVKLGGRDGQDVVRIQRIREALHRAVEQSPSPVPITLRVDANQAWTVSESIQHAIALSEYDVELIEQPVAAHDLAGLAEVTHHSPVPIVADESVYGAHDLLRILDGNAADMVNIKLMKTGGIREAMRMVEHVLSAGMDFMIGSMMEGPASVSAAVQFAAATECKYVDLDAAYFLAEFQATGGIQYDGPNIHLPAVAGIGVSFPSQSRRSQA